MTKKLFLATLALALLLVPASAAFAANDVHDLGLLHARREGHEGEAGRRRRRRSPSASRTPRASARSRWRACGSTSRASRRTALGSSRAAPPRSRRHSSDSACPSGSLIGTGYARNIAGNRTNFDDGSIRCYLTLRLHNAGAGKLALFVKGDPNLAGDKNCPIALATAIPISVTKSSTGSTIKLVIPESLKHPIATLTNSLVEMSLKVTKKTTKAKGRTVGMFEATGQCSAGKRAVTYTFSNEGGNVSSRTPPRAVR